MADNPTDPLPATKGEFRTWFLNTFCHDPEVARAIHLFSDVDKAYGAQHHTLGTTPTQAKPGNS